MADIVTLDWPSDGVALITMTNPEINNHGSWQGIYELWQALVAAREAGALVSVLSSGVPGRPRGVCCMNDPTSSGSRSLTCAFMGVSMSSSVLKSKRGCARFDSQGGPSSLERHAAFARSLRIKSVS